MANRAQGWLTQEFHFHFREIMLHAAAREGLTCPAYCMMPDHIHLVWMGLGPETDQRNGMKFLREHLAPALRPVAFQHQAHDHVLRDAERTRGAFSKVCAYILENPVRAALIAKDGAWPFSGAVIFGYPALRPFAQDFWPLFWKLYVRLRDPAAREIRRPRF